MQRRPLPAAPDAIYEAIEVAMDAEVAATGLAAAELLSVERIETLGRRAVGELPQATPQDRRRAHRLVWYALGQLHDDAEA